MVGTATDGIDYGRAAGYHLFVQLPASITPELLTLELRHRDVDSSLREERAVSVVPSFWSRSARSGSADAGRAGRRW